MGRVVRQTACGKCGSSDALAVYEDGSTYCWSAYHTGRKWGMPEGHVWKPDAMSERGWTGDMTAIEQLPSANMLARGIDAKIAAKYGVRVEYDSNRQEVAYYFPLYSKDGNKLLGYQKKAAKGPGLREKGDTFRIGEGTTNALPFGAHVNYGKGRFVVVVEGAEDALAATQMFEAEGKGFYRVVATLGTDGWRNNLEFFESFDKVCIAYDMNDGGRLARDEFASALSHGKAFVMNWNASNGDDPNALLVNGQGKLWYSACMAAKPYEAAGIVFGEEVWKRMENYTAPECVPYPPEFAALNAKMGGLRMGEISTWIAGSSIGKTSFIRRIKQHVLTLPQWKQAEVELEERGEKTWRGLMQFHAGARWHHLTQEQRRKAYEETYGTGRIFTVDNGLDAKARKGGLIGKFKHLHYDKGCRLFYLDHITLGVREFGDKGGSLADQDSMMEELLGFVESTNSHMCLISHLRKPPAGGDSWSEGAIPCEEDMKGSGSLYQISADIIAVSRNKQHPDDYQRNVSLLSVTKCRETGDTGPADRLYWNHMTSTLEQAQQPADSSEDGDTPL